MKWTESICTPKCQLIDLKVSVIKRWLEEYSNNQVYIEPSNEFEVCSACQESPCLCSDRERTSTIHDF